MNDQHKAMIYLKSILVGAAASALTVITFSVVVVTIIWCFPDVAERIFSAQRHELGWGASYDFPLWQTVIVGLLAFAIAFGWMLRRSSARR